MALNDKIDGHYDFYDKAQGSNTLTFQGLGSIHYDASSSQFTVLTWTNNVSEGDNIPSTGGTLGNTIQLLKLDRPDIEFAFKWGPQAIGHVFFDGAGFVSNGGTYGTQAYWIKRP